MEKMMYNLTSPQKSIWLTEQFSSNTNINNISGYVFINEAVNFEALEKALNLYIERNDATRFKIQLVDGEPKQYVEPYSPFKIDLICLKDMVDVEKLNTEIVCTPFSVINSNLFRITMFKLENGYGGFNATLHHFVSDAWNMSLLISQVMDDYSKLVNNETVDSTPNPSYIEYISSEREYFNSSRFIKDSKFWDSVFSEEPEVSYISTNREQNLTTISKRKIFELDSNLYGQLTNFCKNYNCSIYAFFMAIYSLYIAKLNNTNSPIIGTPVLNRSNFKEKHTCGMFVSTVPFKTTFNPNTEFLSYLKDVIGTQLSVFRHQKYPYSKLLENIKSKYNLTENLYDLVLSYQNARDNQNTSNVNYYSKWLLNGNILDTLQIHFYDMDDTGNLSMYYDYQTAKLSENEIINIHNRILEMASKVLSNPNIIIKELEITTAEEREKILNEFNSTEFEYNKNETIVELFEKQVKNNPNKTAIIFEGKKLTYNELNEKANKLANYLINKGIARNNIVGIMLPRSLEILISVWAVLKTGAAYLLIDPTLPEERINYMLKNASSPILITNSNSSVNFENTLFIDQLEWANLNCENVNVESNNEDTFCVIYTSGSTGIPKGVELKRLGIINMLYSYKKFLYTDACENFLSISTVAFDMFIVENFVPLLSGKTVILANEDEQKVPVFMSNLISKYNIDFILSTPSKIELLLFSDETKTCLKNVKVIQLGGEILTKNLYERLRLITNSRIFDGYGPSECTACCSNKEITDGNSITIGKPFLNTKIYILNSSNNLLPVGYPGELCVCGDGVGKGYINNKPLTSSSFVNSPFENKIMYKTGDMAKYNHNGELIYLGRKDSQIKLHGLRIELDEITNKIMNIPGITNAVSVIKKVNGIDCICSYIICNNSSITEEKIKLELRSTLPHYMIPSHIMTLEKLPITLNGKVDAKKLPDISVDLLEYVAPKTKTEEIILRLWEEILEVNKISTNMDFFSLGGDSLCSIKLVSEIYSKLNVKIGIKDIFDYPTISKLATYIDSLSCEKNKMAPITKSEPLEAYPLSSAQERIYYTMQIAPNSINYNTPGGLIFNKIPNIEKLENCFNTLINSYTSLRTYFVLQNGHVVQKILDHIDFKLTVKNAENKTKQELFEDFVQPFDLEQAPLFRAVLYILKDNSAMLLIDMHHIICDGESIFIFVNNLCKLYNGEQISAPSIDYTDYAVWENKQIDSDGFKQSENYWLKQFEGEIPILNMPTNYPRPTVQSFEGAKIYKTFENSSQVFSLCKKLNTTPYAFLLSAYYILLYKYTYQTELVVGSPVVGRNSSDLNGIIGMFVNTMALKTHIEPANSFKTFLNNVTNHCFNAFENQTYPFNELLKKLNINRDASRNPLFDTMFTYQNNGRPNINLNDLSADYYIPDNHTSKFDFSLEIVPEREHLNISLEYCTKIFTEEFMQNFLQHYLNIINEIIENEQICINKIKMLSSDEMSLILNNYNNTFVNYNKDETIYSLIEKQAKKTPNAIAIKFKEQEITYKQMDELSNSLAHYLKAMGVGKGSIVGIMLSRSTEVLIAIIASLKTGACYVTIDPTFPQNRIEYMLENSNCKIVLTFENLMSKINFSNMLDVSLNNTQIYSGNKESLNTKVEPTSPSYIIYTSGSTGKPKGVMLTHMALTNLTNYLNENVIFLKQDFNNMAMVSMTTISFDIFIFETLICLQKGLKIVMATEDEQTSPTLLNNLIEKENIKAIQLTPSRMQFFVDNYNLLPNLSNIDFVTLAGEALPNNLLKSLLNIGIKKVYNGYGPSETTVFSTFTDVTNYEDVTIGKPLDNTKIYLLDKSLNLVPIGTPGEIYIAGDGLALEYVNNPEITKASFIKNPFEPNALMYKTGDMAKYLSNGELSYIGRADHQIKIRGLRIELDEIQKWILQFPNINKVLLMAQKTEKRSFLVAYIVPNERISISQLRTFLKTNLPQYMVPSYFVILDDFPYLPNGKVDKKSLPLPKNMAIGSKIAYVAPVTKLETQIASLFEKILSVSPIGLDDNFFHLGGDSLSAMTLQVELIKMAENVTYSDIFMCPTVRELAIKLQTNKKEHYEVTNSEELIALNSIIANGANIPNNLQYSPIGNIILTGATGFLGIHILANYLETEKGIAYCIVRSEPGISIHNKFLNKLHFYFGNKYDKLIGSRIILINGDISKTNLDLEEKSADTLFSNINCIINSAAKVSHFGDYNSYKEINVDGLENLLKVAKKYNKRFYQISTLSISGNSLADQSFMEQNFENDFDFTEKNFYISQNLDNVYVRSKFEAEKLVLTAIKNGVAAYILRIGNLMGRFSDGKFQKNVEENAYINRLLSFSKIKCIPNYISDGYLEFTPVDKCAEGIINIIKYPNIQNRIFHLLNHNTISLKEFLKIYNSIYGEISIVSSEEFINTFNKLMNSESTKQYVNGILSDFNSEHKLVYDSKVKLNSNFTVDYLSKIGFSWPSIDEDYIKLFFNYLSTLGYFNK